jgi:uncharacterized protein YutE (UPF0331/DUF86 family)
MDPALIERKLESLDRCVQRINEKYPESAGELAEDYDRQDIIAVNLERGVQSCVDLASHLLAAGSLPLPATAADAFRSLAAEGLLDRALAEQMTKAVGLRNIAAHEYSRLDWEQIHEYLPHALDDLRGFARAVAERMDP